jgi:hypothetical protein
LTAVIVLVLLSAGVWWGCGRLLNSSGSSSSSDEKMSPATIAYMDEAMPKLDIVLRKFDNGNLASAAKLWKSIGNVPTANYLDEAVAKDYLTYANNVRYYMIGDGSATLKDVEDSRTKAKTTLEALRP